MFVSSRVKADKNSKKVRELAIASKNVNLCTAAVVAVAKSGQESLTDESNLLFFCLKFFYIKKFFIQNYLILPNFHCMKQKKKKWNVRCEL